MGLESMRGGYGRCPPLLVGGLLVVCLILTCSWWSLSSQNYELLKQVEEIGEQLKRCADERDQSIQLHSSVESRLKNREEELAQLRVRLEQQDINADEYKKQLDEKDAINKRVSKELESQKNSFTMCNTELESLKKVDLSKDEMISSLKVEKEGLLLQREERKKENDKMKTDLQKALTDLSNLKASQAAAINSKNQVLPPGKPSVPGIKVNAVVAKPSDLNADEKDEDNAKERDDVNLNEPADAEDERFDKNNDDNDGNNIPEENAPEDSVDQMAHAIQEDIIDGQAVAPPSKGATP